MRPGSSWLDTDRSESSRNSCRRNARMNSVEWIDDGRGQVNAVRTTGIYCRAGCAGRPKAENVDRLRSPAEAEANGFRPCLRCRSDQLPAVTADETLPPLVGLALIQICSGYLDDHSEAELGSSIGVSGRHLRRLFTKNVGATPSQVAQSRRAHFARLLLDDSDLSITDIAFCAGFGSSRRMNDVMLEIFKFTPTELRRRRTKSSSVDGGLHLRLSATRAIGFDRLLQQLSATAIGGLETIVDGTYRRTTNVCGHPGVIEISGTSDDLELVVVAHLPTLAGLIDEVARCRRLVGLDTASPPDKPGPWDCFESVVRAFFESSNRPSEAQSLLEELVANFGDPVPRLGEHQLTRLFPTPRSLLDSAATEGHVGRFSAGQLAELASLQISGGLAVLEAKAINTSLDATTIDGGTKHAISNALLRR